MIDRRVLLLAGWALCVVTGPARADTTSQDTVFFDSSTDSATEATEADSATTRNPLVAAGLSAVLPGGGQYYSRRFVRGVLFGAAEVGLGLYAYNRYRSSASHDASAKRCDAIYWSLWDTAAGRLSSAAYADWDTTLDDSGVVVSIDSTDTATIYSMSADTARYKRDRRRMVAYQAAAWAAGCYLFSIMDALEKSGYFVDDEPRNPRLAGWLSAVPGLGLGQIYNRKYSKAGLIWMVQWSAGYMALNNHRLMVRCEDELSLLRDTLRAEYTVAQSGTNNIAGEWESMRKEAFRKRNTYLWYSIFFYLYGIFDAVADAHLHDYRRRMRLEPDLQPLEGAVGLRLTRAF